MSKVYYDEDANLEVLQGKTIATLSAAEAAQKGDVIQILAPDQYQAGIYKESIAPHLKAGEVLMFSHGFNIHYHQIIPPRDVDVVMVAPKGPGDLVRRMYQEGPGNWGNPSRSFRNHFSGRDRNRPIW